MDESQEVMNNLWNDKKGLHFWCKAIPISKQSKNKLKKDIASQILKKRTQEDIFLKDLSKKYYNEIIDLVLIFSIHKSRWRTKSNDVDNLIKHTLDCLKSELFEDDGQIKKITATKYLVKSSLQEGTGIIVSKFEK